MAKPNYRRLKNEKEAARKARAQSRLQRRQARTAVPALNVRYPQFASVRIELDFSDAGPFTPVPQVCVLHPPSTAHFSFPCPYTDCDGEFDLAAAVQELAASGETHASGQLYCEGHRLRAEGAAEACRLLVEFSISAPRA